MTTVSKTANSASSIKRRINHQIAHCFDPLAHCKETSADISDPERTNWEQNNS